jgi:cold shock protein
MRWPSGRSSDPRTRCYHTQSTDEELDQLEPAIKQGYCFDEATMATMNGTIKRLTDKGFGFIVASDGNEYFFHQSACSGVPFDELREGQPVTFERGQGPKGPRAENVRVGQ